jgi:hypothetical protein
LRLETLTFFDYLAGYELMKSSIESLDSFKRPYVTRPVKVAVEFAVSEQVIKTLEGPVVCYAGDAILTGTQGERWPLPKPKFHQKYLGVPGQLENSNGYYIKRKSSVDAVQLYETLEIELSEGRGKLCGNAGDWCVWYSKNDCAIVAGDIFPTLYESNVITTYVQLGDDLTPGERKSAFAALKKLVLVMEKTPVVFVEQSEQNVRAEPVWFRIVKQPKVDRGIIQTIIELGVDDISTNGEVDLAVGVKQRLKNESVLAYSLRNLRNFLGASARGSDASGNKGRVQIVIQHLAAIEVFNTALSAKFGQEGPYPFIEGRDGINEPPGLKKICEVGSVADSLANVYQTRWQQLVFSTTTDIADSPARKLVQRLPYTLIGLGLFAAVMLASYSELSGRCSLADPFGFKWCANEMWERWSGPLFFAAYALALSTAWKRYSTAKIENWEAKHQDYRLLAESLRVQHVFSVLGAPTCVARELPLENPTESGWVLLALQSIYFDASKSGINMSTPEDTQLEHANVSFVTPQIVYHMNKLLKRRERAILRLNTLSSYGFFFFALMLLILLLNVLVGLIHFPFLSEMQHHLVLIGVVLGLSGWGAMRKVLGSFGLEQELQRGRLVLHALCVAQSAASRSEVLFAVNRFLDDQAQWHALHRSRPIEAATGG